jgi:hypothetical protein
MDPKKRKVLRTAMVDMAWKAVFEGACGMK